MPDFDNEVGRKWKIVWGKGIFGDFHRSGFQPAMPQSQPDASARRGRVTRPKPINRVRLQAQLEEAMNLKEDQTVIIDLGTNEDLARQSATVLGPSLPGGEAGMVVV